MDIKRFQHLEDLLSSQEFEKKDLSYCDLSNLDLEILPISTWNDFLFHHTNFKNTNIKFYPRNLKRKMEYCDLTNCNLSYLRTLDFGYKIPAMGCNFSNTNLDIEWEPNHYIDFTFPDDEKTIKNIKVIENFSTIDYKTILNNPHIYFSSMTFFWATKRKIREIERPFTSEEIKMLVNFIDKMLKEDEKGEKKLVEFFSILDNDNPFNEYDKIEFFLGKVQNKSFEEINLSNIPAKLINRIKFENCSFEKICFPEHYEHNSYDLKLNSCKTTHVYFPTITPSSWQDLTDKRLGNSRITFYRNLYLELGRACNGKCTFCRNQYLEPCGYNFENIRKNLLECGRILDNIVIGGGEPTLFSKDILKLIRNGLRDKRWTIFTNGSNLDKLIDLGREYDFYFNISRHAVSDDINNRILGVKSVTIDDIQKLKEKTYRSNHITFCATCFKGDGLDTVKKLEDYIKFTEESRVHNILFQTLHKDLENNEATQVLPIEDEIFDEMLIKLEEQGYEIGMPIYSTGDYKLIIAKKEGQTISFKKYITKEELEKEWYQACKRTFDLSMDPSGQIYENWHQSSGKVLIKN